MRIRRERGYGPLRIGRELRERGIGRALCAALLEGAEVDWNALAAAARRKRFGAPPADATERARQWRFLHYRGFTSEQIRSALGEED